MLSLFLFLVKALIEAFKINFQDSVSQNAFSLSIFKSIKILPTKQNSSKHSNVKAFKKAHTPTQPQHPLNFSTQAISFSCSTQITQLPFQFCASFTVFCCQFVRPTTIYIKGGRIHSPLLKRYDRITFDFRHCV